MWCVGVPTVDICGARTTPYIRCSTLLLLCAVGCGRVAAMRAVSRFRCGVVSSVRERLNDSLCYFHFSMHCDRSVAVHVAVARHTTHRHTSRRRYFGAPTVRYYRLHDLRASTFLLAALIAALKLSESGHSNWPWAVSPPVHASSPAATAPAASSPGHGRQAA